MRLSRAQLWQEVQPAFRFRWVSDLTFGIIPQGWYSKLHIVLASYVGNNCDTTHLAASNFGDLQCVWALKAVDLLRYEAMWMWGGRRRCFLWQDGCLFHWNTGISTVFVLYYRVLGVCSINSWTQPTISLRWFLALGFLVTEPFYGREAGHLWYVKLRQKLRIFYDNYK